MGQGFKKNLKRLREKNGLTQSQLCDFLAELGTPLAPSQISDYEQGKATPMTKTALNLAKILGVSVEKLFEERKKIERKPKKKPPKKKEPTPLELYFKKRDKSKKQKPI